jgi:Zn ribbon nucleic-acid-binding protein
MTSRWKPSGASVSILALKKYLTTTPVPAGAGAGAGTAWDAAREATKRRAAERRRGAFIVTCGRGDHLRLLWISSIVDKVWAACPFQRCHSVPLVPFTSLPTKKVHCLVKKRLILSGQLGRERRRTWDHEEVSIKSCSVCSYQRREFSRGVASKLQRDVILVRSGLWEPSLAAPGQTSL